MDAGRAAARWVGWYGHNVFYQAPLYSYFLAAGQKLHADPVGLARLAQAAAVGAIALLMALVTGGCSAGGRGLRPD